MNNRCLGQCKSYKLHVGQVRQPHRVSKLLHVIYAILNASLILERNKTHLERNATRFARNETRGGNLLLSGTVTHFEASLVIKSWKHSLTTCFSIYLELPSKLLPQTVHIIRTKENKYIYYIDRSVLLENMLRVKLILNYIQDPSGVFSISSLVTSFPALSQSFVETVGEKWGAIDLSI